MGADAKTTVWDHDRIMAEANRRGGIVAEYFASEKGHFGYYVYPNPLSPSPRLLGVAYWACVKPYGHSPMGLFEPWEDTPDEFKVFRSHSNNRYRGASLGKHSDDELRQIFEFMVWAGKNALIANWEVWT